LLRSSSHTNTDIESSRENFGDCMSHPLTATRRIYAPTLPQEDTYVEFYTNRYRLMDGRDRTLV